ncbi:polysaccharide deacetylase family protein [Krasilnikovia sp. MM14-A1004]|uniref:polysaccharide deacetylase family protein n=1 Tax=Krasilnikovia sp. MM14-A1004 TaxID=3373541 RepID=UPI00399CDE37
MPWQTPDEQTPVDGPGVAGSSPPPGGRHRRPRSLGSPSDLRRSTVPTDTDHITERHWTGQAGRSPESAATHPAQRHWTGETASRSERHWTSTDTGQNWTSTDTGQNWTSTDGTDRHRTAAEGGGRRRADDTRAGHRAEGQPRAQRRTRRSSTGAATTGRHMAPAETRSPAITVRALPSVRDAVADGLPAARRMAGAMRAWALDPGDKPPATGAHRAPGTLPIESWLLIGRHRQQALLASLVAAGLMLVAIPVQQHQQRVDAVNAAEQAIAAQHRAGKSTGKAPRHASTSGHQNGEADNGDGRTDQQDADKQSAPQPTASAPTASTDGSATDIPAALPKGSGPAHSLRTTGSSAVALTFDDGPDPVQTPKLLDLLAQHDIKATFCLVGTQVQKHPEIVRDIVAAGHTLCNHTWNHSLTIGKAKPAQIQADLERTNEAIRAAVPGAEIPYFRAPGGNFTDRLVRVAATDDMTSLYWEVDPRDWEHPPGEGDAAHVDKVVDGIKHAVRPGSIVLSHDFSQPDTIEAYERLLPWLTKNFRLGLPTGPQPEPTEPTQPAPTPTESTPADPAPSAPPAAAPPADAPDEQPVQP